MSCQNETLVCGYGMGMRMGIAQRETKKGLTRLGLYGIFYCWR